MELSHLEGQKQFRIIPSVFPTINFFEELVDPVDMEILWEIESLTNERIRQEIGDIFLVSPEDRVSGHGSSVVMAAFTHIHKHSRFSDGSFGIYYAALSIETAISETVYHREQFLRATCEAACEITMRLYEGKIKKPLHDIRDAEYDYLHNPDDYTLSQSFGAQMRKERSWGLLYNSVRHADGQCIAIYRPPAITIPKQVTHFRYVWNGKKMIDVLSTKSVFNFVDA